MGLVFLSIPKDFSDTSTVGLHKVLSWCEAKIKLNYKLVSVVEATMYHPVEAQTNANPDIVADGTRFNVLTAGGLKWIAVSRDLHARWGGELQFGDIVYIEVANKTGFYLIKDIMNKRFRKRIDFLESPGAGIYRYNKALLYLVESESYSSDELWAFNLNHKKTEQINGQYNSKDGSHTSREVRIAL